MSEAIPIETLFQELIELPSEAQRQEYLQRVCGDDADLRQKLQRLAQCHDQAGSFLRDDSFDETRDLAPQASAGQSVGPYKLRELIGEGGMGSVYVAEQEKPLKRKVALKVIKPGMDSKAVLGRFEAERNALALMNHPNIAKVFDAGQTEQGHPYFVMELVNGVPITEYCDRQKLTIRERLELYIDVCQAIQHAHQKGIIHRDIKPTNVLVTELDGKPIAKVIDFGVAKALNQSLTDHSVYTAFQTIIGTPLYMSPEQASFSAVDVDTRSDVYSLGVLLYELLTGTTPLTDEELKQAAQEEVFRFIRETEPPKPSNRISTLGKTALTISQCRRTQPDQLGRTIKGDLDWIVLKALAKERCRRYKTSDALAEDVERYLKDAPIEARPDSMFYRVTRFCRRNRTAVWLCAAGFALVCGAFFLILRNNIRLEEARHRANREALVARELLAENQTLLIQRALMSALEGKLEAVDRIIHQYLNVAGASIGSDEWPDILRAAAHIHSGQYQQAKTLLHPMLKEGLNNVIPATALLSVAHMYDGDWDPGIIYANKIRDVPPRSGEFEDLDKLCLGYALVFVDTEEALRLLSEVLKRNPTWIQAHAILADAQILQGNLTGTDAPIDDAFSKANALVELFEETPFALNVCLYAHLARIQRCQLHDQGYSDLVQSGQQLVLRLEKHDQFILAKTMPAQFFDAVGDDEKAKDYWRKAIPSGSQMWRWAAFGRLYWDTPSPDLAAEIDQLVGHDEQPWVLATKAYVLSDVAGGREEAWNIFERIRSNTESSLSDRFFAIQIPLLLGEKDKAVAAAESWISDSRNDERSLWNEIEYFKIVASDGEYRPKQDNRLTRMLTNYFLGLLAIADGERNIAIQRFEESIKRPFVGLDAYWGEAFLRNLRRNSNWPSENRQMRRTFDIHNE